MRKKASRHQSLSTPLLIIVVVGVVGWYLLSRNTNNIEAPLPVVVEDTSILIPEKVQIVTDQKKGPLLVNGEPAYDAKYTVPVGLPGSDIILADAKKNMFDATINGSADTSTDSTVGSEFNYTASFLGLSPNKKFLIYTIDELAYSSGAAHPSHVTSYRTFDQKNMEYSIKNFFTDRTKAIKIIAKAAREKLIKKSGNSDIIFTMTDSQFSDGTAPTEDNYNTNIALLSDGIHVVFNEYQIASYADGNFEVTVPYTTSRLTKLIDPKFLE